MPNDVIIKDSRGNPVFVSGGNLHTMNFGSLVPEKYDYIILTYVASGNGEGEIETVTYKLGGSGGTTTAVLTLTYNSDNCLVTVTKA